jgi:Tol biopolymer transport system component
MKKIKLPIISCCLLSILVLGTCEEVETDNTPPTITITHPSPNSEASEILTITCMAYDNIGIEKVELWIDGLSTGLEDYTEPYSFDWNTTQLDDMIYTIIVRAVDESGNITDSSPLSLEVNNRDSHPSPVELYPIEYTNNTFIVRWSSNNDGDFDSYRLLESISGEPASMSEIYSTTDIIDTVFVVSEVLRRDVRYYQVSVMDTVGLISNSQIVDRVVHEEFTFSLYDSDANQIYMMDETGANLTNLSNNDYNDYSPIWFPDGDQLLFLRPNPSPSHSSVLMMMDGDGSNQSNLSTLSAQHSQVSISNDGSMVLFVSRNLNEIFLMDIPTGSNTCLSDPNFMDSSPKFSPDNTCIVYSSRHTDSWESDIFMMNVDGSGKTNLTNTETTSEEGPIFSPDGTNLIYWSYYDLHSMNLDGTNKINITNDMSSQGTYKFSPDGFQVIYVGFATDIFLINTDGASRLNLTNGNGYSDNPVFFPDSESILFASNRDGVKSIYKIDTDGTNELNLVNLDGGIGQFEFRP